MPQYFLGSLSREWAGIWLLDCSVWWQMTEERWKISRAGKLKFLSEKWEHEPRYSPREALQGKKVRGFSWPRAFCCWGWRKWYRKAPSAIKPYGRKLDYCLWPSCTTIPCPQILENNIIKGHKNYTDLLRWIRILNSIIGKNFWIEGKNQIFCKWEKEMNEMDI